jgi:hypothetical protein
VSLMLCIVIHRSYTVLHSLAPPEMRRRGRDGPYVRLADSNRKVLRSMPEPIASSVELVSFHSISKGMSGECGRRGGYFECVNISDDVMDQVYKMASVSLCPPVSGQVSRCCLATRPVQLVPYPQPIPSANIDRSVSTSSFPHLNPVRHLTTCTTLKRRKR